jgi:hypothetical protein
MGKMLVIVVDTDNQTADEVEFEMAVKPWRAVGNQIQLVPTEPLD